ncbi:hypothetical protein ABK040_001594 [Willaertia magna]
MIVSYIDIGIALLLTGATTAAILVPSVRQLFYNIFTYLTQLLVGDEERQGFSSIIHNFSDDMDFKNQLNQLPEGLQSVLGLKDDIDEDDAVEEEEQVMVNEIIKKQEIIEKIPSEETSTTTTVPTTSVKENETIKTTEEVKPPIIKNETKVIKPLPIPPQQKVGKEDVKEEELNKKPIEDKKVISENNVKSNLVKELKEKVEKSIPQQQQSTLVKIPSTPKIDVHQKEQLQRERKDQEEEISFERRILGDSAIGVAERIKYFEEQSKNKSSAPSIKSIIDLGHQRETKSTGSFSKPVNEFVETQKPVQPIKDDVKPVEVKPEVPRKQLSLRIKAFIQREEDYLYHLGELLPKYYKDEIMNNITDASDKATMDRLFFWLINNMCADGKHLKVMELKRHLAENIISEQNDEWLTKFGEIILDFVQYTLCGKYIEQYLVEYTKSLRYKVQQILLNDDKKLLQLIENSLDIKAREHQRKDSDMLEVLSFEDIISQPTSRLTYYLVQFRDIIAPLIPDDHACPMLSTAIYKLEKSMIAAREKLERAYQLNKHFEIQRRLGIENLSNFIVSDKTPEIGQESNDEGDALRLPRFIYSIHAKESTSKNYAETDNDSFIYKLKSKNLEKSLPCEAYLFENVLIISWVNQQTKKRERKLYYIDSTTQVEKWEEKGFKLVYSPEKQKIFECQSSNERRRWIRYIRMVTNANGNNMMSPTEVKQVMSHLKTAYESPETKYSIDINTVMKNRKDYAIYEEPEVNSVNISFDDHAQMIGATLEKLIERMTTAHAQDTIRDAFLLTYHSITTPETFLNHLTLKWNTPPTEEIRNDNNAFANFIKTTLIPIRINIYKILKRWISDHSYDFRNNANLTKQLSNFIENHMAKTFENLADNLRIELKKLRTKRDTLSVIQKQYLEKQMKELEDKEQEKGELINAPKPILPSTFKFRNLNETKVLDWSSVEIARQITLIESAIFMKIQPKELLSQAWNKNPKASPNVVEIIQRTNTVVLWVAHQILEQKKEEKRVWAIRKFIKIARELRKINNFNGLKEIIGGLRSIPIGRLKKHWAQVPKKLFEEYKELEKIVSTAKNYKEMRSTIKECPPPLLPFIGIQLTDITFVEDGNKDFINEEKKIINFFKRQKLAAIIQTGIKRFQQQPYYFKPVLELKNKLANLVHFNEDKLFEISCAAEPKENNNN